MNIKDFTPGQTAYALQEQRGKTTHHIITQYTVISVGRKYVHAKPVKGYHEEQFFKMREVDEYLSEKEDWGGSRLKLFPTEAEAQDYIEKTMLQDWLQRAVTYGKIEGYSLEQLRAVREILEGKDDG